MEEVPLHTGNCERSDDGVVVLNAICLYLCTVSVWSTKVSVQGHGIIECWKYGHER